MKKKGNQYLKISSFILGNLLFVSLVKAQKKDFIYCHFDQGDVRGNFITVQCPYFFNGITNNMDSIRIWSDSLYYDESDSTYSRVYQNMNMEIWATIDSGGFVLDGPVYMTHAGDTIFWGYHQMGLREGYTKYHYAGKTIIGFFKNGLLEGEVEEISQDGSRSLAAYRLGKRHGIQFTTDPNGRVTAFAEYRNGKQNGAEIAFHENGLPRYILHVKNDKVKKGTYYAYNIDGDVTKIVRYKKGKPRIEFLYPPLPSYLIR